MHLKGKRIFIVEDDPRNRIVYHMTLIKEGALVEFERRGKDALRRMEDMSHIDLVIMDLMLADGVSGFDVFDEIRATDRFQDVPIVAVSAADTSTTLPLAMEKGFDGYIAKPINVDTFGERIARLIAREKVFEGI